MVLNWFYHTPFGGGCQWANGRAVCEGGKAARQAAGGAHGAAGAGRAGPGRARRAAGRLAAGGACGAAGAAHGSRAKRLNCKRRRGARRDRRGQAAGGAHGEGQGGAGPGARAWRAACAARDAGRPGGQACPGQKRPAAPMRKRAGRFPGFLSPGFLSPGFSVPRPPPPRRIPLFPGLARQRQTAQSCRGCALCLFPVCKARKAAVRLAPANRALLRIFGQKRGILWYNKRGCDSNKSHSALLIRPMPNASPSRRGAGSATGF